MGNSENDRATAPLPLLIDLDGVIYQGNEAVPGARECVAWLEAQRIPHLFVTNTTLRPRSALVEKLSGIGIDIEANRISTLPLAAVAWLERHACHRARFDRRIASVVAIVGLSFAASFAGTSRYL
jgi:ribonucleotide monophosphatase NagD (HAD superfamily)